MNYKAYLIVICDNVTNEILSATIWSSPEWEQSRCLEQRTYVAYASGGESFADAKEGILRAMEHPKSRYRWLLNYLDEQSKPTVTGEKSRVFEGSLDECQQFVRANRFSVILSQMEIRDGHVYAIRHDG